MHAAQPANPRINSTIFVDMLPCVIREVHFKQEYIAVDQGRSHQTACTHIDSHCLHKHSPGSALLARCWQCLPLSKADTSIAASCPCRHCFGGEAAGHPLRCVETAGGGTGACSTADVCSCRSASLQSQQQQRRHPWTLPCTSS